MKTDINLQQVLHALKCPSPAELAHVNERSVVFAWEKDVDFQMNRRRTVSQDSLVPAEDFPGPFAASFASGPDWVNASALPLGDGRFLITIATGRGVGNPHPSINVSHEMNVRVDTLLTKDLITAT